MSLWGTIGKLAGKGLKIASPVIGGAVEGARGIAGKLLRRGAKNTLRGAGEAAGKVLKSPGGKLAAVGLGGVAAGGVMGEIMGRHAAAQGMHRRRRMNPGNSRAMRRAIRRIESGARLYSRFFAMKHGHIKHAPHVRIKAHHRRVA